MKTKLAFITNSSSSALIVWVKTDLEDFVKALPPEIQQVIPVNNLKLISGETCPHCGSRTGVDIVKALPYLDEHDGVLLDHKKAEGYQIYFTNGYLGSFDRFADITWMEEGGAIERQGPEWAW